MAGCRNFLIHPGFKSAVWQIRNVRVFKYMEDIASNSSSDIHDMTLDLIQQRDQLLTLPMSWILRNAD
jgi:hypothetical protein